MRISIETVEGKGTLRRLTPEEVANTASCNNPNKTYMGFFPPKAKVPKLTFQIDDCFDQHGFYFREAVE